MVHGVPRIWRIFKLIRLELQLVIIALFMPIVTGRGITVNYPLRDITPERGFTYTRGEYNVIIGGALDT
jgi:hypothetical protein